MITIDSDTWIGRSSGGAGIGAHDVSVPDLIAQMDRAGVDVACVHHALSREWSPAAGNDELLAAVADEPRLIPVATLLPHHTGEFVSPDRYAEVLFDHRVQMVRVCPSSELHSHRFSLSDWVFGQALAELEYRRVPLVVDFGLFRRSEPPWPTLVALLEGHPNLPVLLPEVQARNNRNLYALLDQHPTLVIQSQGFFVHHGIEDVCDRFGPERIVLGSGFPTKSMGGAVFHVQRAQISEEHRAMILGGTMEQLLARRVCR